ncbi:hypothetical protein [Streptomyces sp. NPDC054797]
MEIRFEGGVVAESVSGQIGCVPRFSVGGRFVVVSPYADRWGREKFIGATFGSMDWLWEGDDEIRFDKETRDLVGVLVALPEEEDPAWDGTEWLRLPQESGGARARAAEDFSARPMDVRWVAPGAKAIVCAYSASTSGTSGLRRLRVAPDFDLVAAADGTYAGWILENPADCVVEAFEDRRPDAATGAFRETLAEFLDLFVEPRIDMMQDEDPALLVRLEALLARVSALPHDPRHDAMRMWMLQVREDWYGIAG